MSSIKYRGYEELSVTTNLALIAQIVESDDEVAKAWVVDNPMLSYAQVVELANDEDIVVRRELAKASNLPLDVLRQLCADEVEDVRFHALCNPLTDTADYSEGVLTGKFSAAYKKRFCGSFRVAENVEVFKFLAESVKTATPMLIDCLNAAIRASHPNIDSRIVPLLHDELRAGGAPNKVRESYAGADQFALPEILDELKDDPYRPVINALAANSAAWVSTHEYLVGKHKTSLVRIFVAMATRDNDLLNKIYHGTQSKEIRYWVEANPVFVCL